MQKTTTTVLAISLALSGCATSSSNIAASYTSPVQYQSYDCAQLASEAQRIHNRTSQMAGRLDEAANNDKVLMGVGMVLFWPALFALGGTKQQEADYARLKGEHDAIGQAMIARKCDLATPTAQAQPQSAPQALASSPGLPTASTESAPTR
ncbi:MAG: hypothetical protein PHT57_11050 [Rhodoferax sp.]|nr:hypothetical protein [Rhodoferax sp.]